MKRILMVVAAALVAALAWGGWIAWPIYGFFAHNGDAPLPPTEWTSLPTPEPTTLSTAEWSDLPARAPDRQALYDPFYAKAGDAVTDALAAHRAAIGAPGLSAAVTIDGALVWAGAVGWSDLETQKPLTVTKQFRIGSTSKALTATALARLVDRGVIGLDQPLREIMDPLPNKAWAEITPRQLASHMAGLPHYGENTDPDMMQAAALRRHYPDLKSALTVFDEAELLSEPGTAFFYSSFGTVLLGAAMADAAGMSYRELMQQEVFGPAGIERTIVAPKKPGPDSALATFYYRDGERYRPWRPVDLSHRLPGGGWASTPSDTARIGALQFKPGYLSDAVKQEFWTPQRLASGEVNEQDYAIGWRWREWPVEGLGLARNANHGGVSRGAQSWLLAFPDHNITIAFMINMRTDEFSEFGAVWREIFAPFASAAQEAAAMAAGTEAAGDVEAGASEAAPAENG